MAYSLLPGRIAVLVPDDQPSNCTIVIPKAIQDKWDVGFRPGNRLLAGVVAALGKHRGRVGFPPVGAEVYCVAHAGLTVEPNDLDIPSIGAEVPSGHTLRIYGVGSDWDDNVVVMKNG